MSSEDNVKTIRTAYEAFARGDVAAVMEMIDDDCDWGVEAAGVHAAYYGVRHGKSEVLAFFQDLASTLEVEQFEPTAIAGDGDDVLSVVAYAVKSRANGNSARMNIHHHFKVAAG